MKRFAFLALLSVLLVLPVSAQRIPGPTLVQPLVFTWAVTWWDGAQQQQRTGVVWEWVRDPRTGAVIGNMVSFTDPATQRPIMVQPLQLVPLPIGG
jgi:hypothetical protein